MSGFTEVLPEERLAKIILVLYRYYKFDDMDITQLAALLSPYMQIEILETGHQERALCLSDFYNLREKLMQRERESFKKKSELLLQVALRPEAEALGTKIANKERLET